MKCIDPIVTGYERGTLEERSAWTESSPRQSRKNSEDDSRAKQDTWNLVTHHGTEWDQNVLVLEMASGFAVTRAPEYPEKELLDWRLRLVSPLFDAEYRPLVLAVLLARRVTT